MDFAIRPLTAADEPLLWRMLYQALHTKEDAPEPEIVQRPEYARFVEQWGQPGDAGFVAEEGEGAEVLGAVWFRPPREGETPELAVAVEAGQRKRGIGAALLTKWVRANPDQSEISLRVPADHPAARIYERFGFKVVEQKDGRVTMRREL